MNEFFVKEIEHQSRTYWAVYVTTDAMQHRHIICLCYDEATARYIRSLLAQAQEVTTHAHQA